jgi:hypothetical protein
LLVDYILLKETVVWLIGVDGAIRDQQFALDTDTFDIGPPWRRQVGERPQRPLMLSFLVSVRCRLRIE